MIESIIPDEEVKKAWFTKPIDEKLRGQIHIEIMKVILKYQMYNLT